MRNTKRVKLLTTLDKADLTWLDEFYKANNHIFGRRNDIVEALVKLCQLQLATGKLNVADLKAYQLVGSDLHIVADKVKKDKKLIETSNGMLLIPLEHLSLTKPKYKPSVFVNVWNKHLSHLPVLVSFSIVAKGDNECVELCFGNKKKN